VEIIKTSFDTHKQHIHPTALQTFSLFLSFSLSSPQTDVKRSSRRRRRRRKRK
jgi:hypothetical protein